jgi:hypothetical protein
MAEVNVGVGTLDFLQELLSKTLLTGSSSWIFFPRGQREPGMQELACLPGRGGPSSRRYEADTPPQMPALQA